MDVRKLTENSEQFLGRQNTRGSEGGDIGRWKEYWVPCWVGRFHYVLSSQNFPCMTYWSLPSCHLGQESEHCPGLDRCQGSGWPRSRAQALALGHSLPPLPPSRWGDCSPGSVGCLSEKRDGGGGSAWSRKKYEFTEKNRLACRISGSIKERSQTQQPDEAEWTGEKYRTFSKVLIFSKVWERGH